MADDDRGAHLRALERMGVRLVERPPEEVLAVLRRIASLSQPTLEDAIREHAPFMADYVQRVLPQVAPRAAALSEWLASFGEAPEDPGKWFARIHEWFEAERATTAVAPPGCLVSGCDNAAMPDGFCLEHVEAGMAVRDRVTHPAYRPVLARQVIAPRMRRACERQEYSWSGQVCYLDRGHEGEHQYVAVP